MIKVENIHVDGFEAAVGGMRKPMNSGHKSDSEFGFNGFKIGSNDLDLMKRLYSAGSEHRKYLRMIHVSMDITAPEYFFKQFDTYRVGVTENSTSTMHKIAAKPFTIDDFSHEHLIGIDPTTDPIVLNIDDDYRIRWELRDDVAVIVIDNKNGNPDKLITPTGLMTIEIALLNRCRELYLETKDKKYWWQMIQLLPMSYNYTRTVDMNYENVFTIIHQRSGHRLDEWNNFIKVLKDLPYIKEIGGF